jgi:hypothetical protein
MYSCNSYNRQAADYYSNLRQGNFEKAGKALDQNRLLKKNRNRLLYLLEKGKLCHMLQQYDHSNKYFNEADLLMESSKASVKDIAFGTLLNPMMKTYRGEDFEKYLIHYYKSLNYLQLGQPAEALVEARRISLRSYAQEDKAGRTDHYSEDAFSFMLQGMIYEKNNEINNAFIAYRNAAKVFLDNNGSYYGTVLPLQLKMDVLRTAHLNGFIDEVTRFEKLFNLKFLNEEKPEGGELILFWENGSAPVKDQQDLYFSLFKGSGDNFYFKDGGGLFNIPFEPGAGYSRDNLKAEDIRSLRISLPRYRSQPLFYSTANVEINGINYLLEPTESINSLAISTLKERTLKELTSTLTRVAIKKIAEEAVRTDQKDEQKNGKKDEKKRARNEAIAMGIQIFNFASEKADTRNWQSLPHTIFFTRIPLKAGINDITVHIGGQQSKKLNYSVNGGQGLQFMNICTLR